MKRAFVRISFEILDSLLDLPAGTTILAVGQEMDDIASGTFRVYMSYSDFPDVAEGEAAPQVDLEIVRETRFRFH